MEYIQYNWLYSLVGIIIYVVMLLTSRVSVTLKYPQYNNTTKGIYFFFFLYIFNSVYGLWEWDTYHIWDDFIKAGQYYYFKIDGYEAIYNWLASITGNNYFLWRFIIWTPACILVYYSAKKLLILNRNFLVSLAIFGGFWAFTRGMLGHTMLIYGLVILFCDRGSFNNKLWGCIIIFASYFFHKSMYVNLLFALIALVPFNKNTIKLSIPLFPLAIAIASLTVGFILSGDIDASYGEAVGGVGDKTLRYLEREKTESNTNGYISQIITLAPIYFTAFYLYNRIYIKRYFDGIRNERIYKYLFRLYYVALYISSTYLFLDTSEWIPQRFRYMALFPMVFVLGKVWTMEPNTNKYIKVIILLQLLSILLKYSLQLKSWYAL